MLKSKARSAAADDREQRSARLGIVAEQAGASLGMAVLLLVVVGVMFAAQLDYRHWSSGLLILVVYLTRVLLSKRFLSASNNRKNQSRWEHVFLVSAASSGASWGLFAALLIQLQSAQTDLMGMFLVVSLTAGAIPSLGALPRAYVAYVAAMLAPGIAVLSLRGDQSGLVFAILAVAYVVFLFTTANNFRRRMDTWLEHARVNAELRHYSRHDSLTGLPNKLQFEAEIEHALGEATTQQRSCALLNVDLDQFKVINDTCGHATGDQLLQQAAGFIRRLLRRHDLMGRLGGDEFGILLCGCDFDEARRVADSICDALQKHQFIARERSFRLNASIGLAMTGSGLDAAQDLLRAAEAAAYAAKDSGRGRVHVYHQHDDLLFRRNREMQWALEIPDALDEGRFYLDSQAIVAVAEDADGARWCEILLRMRDRDGNTVMPGEFLPAAERYNLALRLDLWVIQTVLKALAQDRAGAKPVDLCFINLSGQSMGDPGFMERVCALLDESRLPPERLCFEITETAAVDNLEQALELMRRLRELGCRFALDDFGSGLSSFGYLRDFPVEFIKIDGAFVRGITHDPVNRAIVASICEIGHTTSRRIIAEFVENDSILGCLAEIGVDYAQGYGIDVPGRFPGDRDDGLGQRLTA